MLKEYIGYSQLNVITVMIHGVGRDSRLYVGENCYL